MDIRLTVQSESLRLEDGFNLPRFLLEMVSQVFQLLRFEAAKRNRLMKQCFIVCEAAGQDIYDVMQAIFLKETGLDKYIPLPA